MKSCSLSIMAVCIDEKSQLPCHFPLILCYFTAAHGSIILFSIQLKGKTSKSLFLFHCSLASLFIHLSFFLSFLPTSLAVTGFPQSASVLRHTDIYNIDTASV